MEIAFQNTVLPVRRASDAHFNFAEYFFKDELKHFAWLVSRKLEEGHICVHLDEVLDSEPLAHKTTEYCKDLKDRFLNHPLVSSNVENKQPFHVHNERLYIQRYFQYETIVINRIRALVEAGKDQYYERKRMLEEQKQYIQRLFPAQSSASTVSQPDWQLVAALSGILNNFTIITGGPGTGKTTTVAKILAMLFALDKRLKVALAAPTGKAAARMAESLKSAGADLEEALAVLFQSLEPSTIHRLLKAVPDTPHFRHNRENPLNYDVVIVDESSMIDVALLSKLLDAVGPNTRVILLGDKNQLASVEAGSLLGDLCQPGTLNQFSEERTDLVNSFIAAGQHQVSLSPAPDARHPLVGHIVELHHSHRFAQDKGIGRFSKAVINNEVNSIQSFFVSGADDQVIIDSSYSQEQFESFISGYEDFIREKDVLGALSKLKELRVLCALREGEQGVYATNRRIESYLHRKGLIACTGDFYVDRPIMVTRNYYNLELFNGDIGILRRDTKGVIRAWFEDKEGKVKQVLPGYIPQAETVFAMTIHKSQGSEFEKVLVMMPVKDNIPLLTRELLYTAVTRARSKVLIQGTADVIVKTAEASVKRSSGIAERLLEPTT